MFESRVKIKIMIFRNLGACGKRPLCLYFVFLVVTLYSANSAFGGARECWDQIAEIGKNAAVLAWTGPAESGDAEAQFCLGLAIQPGGSIGVLPDPEEQARKARIAIDWIRRSAEQGFAPAQEHLAIADSSGYLPIDGVTQNLEKAQYWHQKAADQGMPFSHIFLAQSYRDGEMGLPQDVQRAYRHLRLAIELIRLQQPAAEFEGFMGFLGLGQEAIRLARRLTVEDRAEADAWVIPPFIAAIRSGS